MKKQYENPIIVLSMQLYDVILTSGDGDSTANDIWGEGGLGLE